MTNCIAWGFIRTVLYLSCCIVYFIEGLSVETVLFLSRFVLLPIFFIFFFAFDNHIVAVVIESCFYLVGLTVLTFIQ